MKKFVPPYCRIMRVDRDIPTHQISGGVKNLNLRELVQKECANTGIVCQCIRCREIGLNEVKNGRKLDWASLRLETIKYGASGGKEFFIQLVDDANLLAGFCRLRFPRETYRPELDSTTAGVRELRVFGTQVPVDEKIEKAAQHKGLGKKLLAKAEEIAGENGFEKLAVTSGVGAREYYKKLGFKQTGAYVVKRL
ncbi:GNAT family N-acetyltransferase [Candidatus Micrarchaeota archaeon]|nr:GNAT family N-acetyltransferase [Candidatus Micrarchaeota archaeon]